jgi:hypothetical protein
MVVHVVSHHLKMQRFGYGLIFLISTPAELNQTRKQQSIRKSKRELQEKKERSCTAVGGTHLDVNRRWGRIHFIGGGV